jgi:hypothetical protein
MDIAEESMTEDSSNRWFRLHSSINSKNAGIASRTAFHLGGTTRELRK